MFFAPCFFSTPMPKEYSRSQRVASQLLRELAELIRSEVKDPRVGFVTLTDLEISPDYAHAQVYFTLMDGREHLDETLAGLRRAAPYLKRELRRRVRIHTTPELHFHFDASVEEGSRMDSLIARVIREDEENAARHADDDDHAPAA